MRNYLLILILMIACTSSLLAAEQGMNETGKAWLKAFQANDLEGVVATYAPDAHLFPPDEVEAVGTAAIRANYANLFNNFTVKDVTATDSHHETMGDLSYGWGLFSITIVPKAGGEPIHMEGRYSDVSRKINGKWLYVVDHASVSPTPPTQTNKQ
ncbi:MAG TPA: DUF4440 domain-containing protein [Acidobacteriota bacterium]|nr:DUF4440 domain-containing protein [Acidobacteriota bacterium]